MTKLIHNQPNPFKQKKQVSFLQNSTQRRSCKHLREHDQKAALSSDITKSRNKPQI